MSKRIAEACADRIRRDVRAAPGSRWQKTGKLLASIAADENGVSVSGDRLQGDRVAQLFADECVNDPTDDTAFNRALDAEVTELLEKELGRE